MTDYIYGIEYPSNFQLVRDWDEQKARDYADKHAGLLIRIPISAIEPLPEPKPALPTTPGSVVRLTTAAIPLHMLDESGWWVQDGNVLTADEMGQQDWTLVFDAGAHDEGKTS